MSKNNIGHPAGEKFVSLVHVFVIVTRLRRLDQDLSEKRCSVELINNSDSFLIGVGDILEE